MTGKERIRRSANPETEVRVLTDSKDAELKLTPDQNPRAFL